MIRERLSALRRDPAPLRTEREAAVASLQFGTDRSLWIPDVQLAPEPNAAPAALIERAGQYDTVAGLDADGRAAIVRYAFGIEGEAPKAVVAHPSEESDDWVIHSRVLTWTGARLEIVGFLTHRGISHVTWVDHDAGGRPVRFVTAGVPHNTEEDGVTEVTCEWDGERCTRAGDHTAIYDGEGLLRVLDGERAIWERSLYGYEPDPLPAGEALSVWVDAIADAAARALGDGDAALLKVAPRFQRHERPALYVVERAYLTDAAARIGAREAIERSWDQRIDLLPFVDEAGLRAWRSLRQQDAEETRAAAVRLQQRLAATAWPGDAIPLVVSEDMWGVAASVLGHERLAPLTDATAPAPPAVERAPADLDELRALLRTFALPDALVEHARWGLALVEPGSGRSKLGGRPELDRDWPVHDGHPLTHLASIALAELPAIPGREDLPAGGTLVFFAALTEDAELWEPTRCDDPRVAVWHVPDGATPAEPPPYDTEIDEYEISVVLPERRVAFLPVLTLPDHPDELSEAEQHSYDQLHERLCELTPGLWKPPHLLLGHPNVTQPYAVGAAVHKLLHLGWDEELEFMFLDGGDLTFHGDPEDMRAGRWEALTVQAESC